MGLAQQPLHLGFLAWFALIPLLYRLNSLTSLKAAIGPAYLWGCTYTLTTIFWLAFNIGTSPVVGVLSMLGSVAFLGLNAVLVVVLWHLTGRKLWVFPLVWVSVEYIRTFGTLGFPWISLANTQIPYLILIQNAEITGIYGISFWLVLLNILGFSALTSRQWKYGLYITALFGLPWLSGYLLLPDNTVPEGPGVSVAVVQPNIKLSDKWEKGATRKIVKGLLAQSQSAIEDNTDLIIWPETAVPSYLLKTDRRSLRDIRQALTNSTSQLLTGISHYEREDNILFTYNAVTLLSKTGVIGLYKKIALVPMAEYIPLSGIFPKLKKLNFGQANFESGEEFTTFPLNSFRFSSVVCFETTFPALIRKFVNAGAQFIIAVVNDGWYEHPPEPQQHAAQFVYRAIETRRPMIRCANTGISMVIDRTGNITDKLELNRKAVIRTEIFPASESTFYLRFGDIFAQLILVGTLFFMLLHLIRKK
ncbi:MAG: apolipoprotein N-acyltransferase [FCB group bacterium]|nr:apolipoprotein N-acyltransferase [FCB group bacterium]